jgi:hypothetical protein
VTSPDPHGEVLRRALHATAEQVTPGEALPAIRARTAQCCPWWRRTLNTLLVRRHRREDVVDLLALTLTRKNGAPGWTPGTPPITAVPMEGATAMSHNLTFERTALGHQMQAALTLAHLIESGPREEAEWKVDGIGRLHGHVNRPHSDMGARAAIDAFANFLRADVKRSQGRNEHSEWIHLSTSATYRGVPVNVWTHVAIRSINPHGSTR